MAEIVVVKCDSCAAYIGGGTVRSDDMDFSFIGEMVVEALRDNLVVDLIRADTVTLTGHAQVCRRRPFEAHRAALDAEARDGGSDD